MVTEKEWRQVRRWAAKHGFSAEHLEVLAAEYGRDMVYLAFDPDIERMHGEYLRMKARQERHEANRAAWLHKRLSENGKKGAAARWAKARKEI